MSHILAFVKQQNRAGGVLKSHLRSEFRPQLSPVSEILKAVGSVHCRSAQRWERLGGWMTYHTARNSSTGRLPCSASAMQIANCI